MPKAADEPEPLILETAVDPLVLLRGQLAVSPPDERRQGPALERRPDQLDGLGVRVLLAEPDSYKEELPLGARVGHDLVVLPEPDGIPVGFGLERAKHQLARPPPHLLGEPDGVLTRVDDSKRLEEARDERRVELLGGAANEFSADLVEHGPEDPEEERGPRARTGRSSSFSVRSVLGLSSARVRSTRSGSRTMPGIVGEGPAAWELREQIASAAQAKVRRILVLGESGTGKEATARAASLRRRINRPRAEIVSAYVGHRVHGRRATRLGRARSTS